MASANSSTVEKVKNGFYTKRQQLLSIPPGRRFTRRMVSRSVNWTGWWSNLAGEVTHLVVRQAFFGEDKVIPVDLIESATEERITLIRERNELMIQSWKKNTTCR
jgi:hypothetical protein